MSINTATVYGNIGSDPELSEYDSGRKRLRFTVATNERLSADRVHTEWHTVIVWGNYALALSNALRQGMAVLVVGSLRTSKWINAEGHKRRETVINARDVRYATAKQAASVAASAASGEIPRYEQPSGSKATWSDGELPPEAFQDD